MRAPTVRRMVALRSLSSLATSLLRVTSSFPNWALPSNSGENYDPILRVTALSSLGEDEVRSQAMSGARASLMNLAFLITAQQ